jgi:Putative zinc-finger
MEGERELASMLRGWAAASRQVESARTESCLTVSEVADFADRQLEPDARARVAEHLSRCSHCTHAVGSLLRAAREFDDEMRLQLALGSLTRRVGACLRVFVDEARGAFTRADALLRGLTPSVRLEFTSVAPGLAMAGTRSVTEDDVGEVDPEALHEVALHAEGLPGVVLLCGEEDGGSLTVSLTEPWEVRLITPDGAIRSLSVERGSTRYYATITGMPGGDYMLALVRPEPGA